MSKKTRNILLIIYLVAFLMTSFGAALAFFEINKREEITASTEVSSATMTSVIYDAGQPLTLYATPLNFNKELKESLTSLSSLSASLKMGTDRNVASFKYDVEVEIFANTMEYTLGKNKPEIILTITDPLGHEVVDVPELDYVSITDVSGQRITGLDLTNQRGTFKIKTDYVIEGKEQDDVTQVWNLKLTFVNYDASQNDNLGRGLSGVARLVPHLEEAQP